MEEPDEELEVLFASWQTCKSQDEQKNTVIQVRFQHGQTAVRKTEFELLTPDSRS